MQHRGGKRALVTAVLGIAASGCVVGETAPPPADPNAAPGAVAVSSPPPAPLTEKQPPRAQAGSVWVGGYWHWSGLQYVWIPGHWERAHAGRQWRAPAYSQRDGSYLYEPPGWR